MFSLHDNTKLTKVESSDDGYLKTWKKIHSGKSFT